jgi:tartronate-semialdehyde synthase
MDYEVSLAFDNINHTGDDSAYGVDHVAVAEGLGCKAVRVRSPGELRSGFEQAKALMRKYRVPVVVECILERVTNVAMGTEIDAITEFDEVLDLRSRELEPA